MEHPEQRAEDVGFWRHTGALAGGLRKRPWAAMPRERRVQVRFTDDELAELQSLAQRLGMAPGSWIAELALAYTRGELQPIPLDWQRVIGEVMRARLDVVRVGTLLNQIARHANHHGQLPESTARVLHQVEGVLRQTDALEREAVALVARQR